jgi:hypothetical protein
VEQHSSWFAGAWVGLFLSLLDDAAADRGAAAWLEKTPIHLQYAKAIQDHVPGARFIHIVRPGLRVVSSVRRVTRAHPKAWGGERSVESCVNRWLLDVSLHRRYIGQSNHYFVHFDRLLENPTAVTAATRKFLGLPDPAPIGAGVPGWPITGPDEPWKDGAARPASASEPKPVSAGLTSAEAAYVEARIRDLDLSVFDSLSGKRRRVS